MRDIKKSIKRLHLYIETATKKLPPRYKKVGSNIYKMGNFYIEKMEDGTWTAYEPYDEDDRYLWKWHSPKHRSRESAARSVSFRIRQIKK